MALKNLKIDSEGVCHHKNIFWPHHIFSCFLEVREGKKKSMEFSILSKTHSPSMEKKIKITWSKNHFYAKISILAKN